MLTPIRLLQTQPPTGETLLYTVPSSYQGNVIQQVILKQIHVCNTTGSAATITLSLVPSGGTATSANRICAAKSVAANDVLDLNLTQVLQVGDFISGLQGTGSALTVTASGIYHT